MNAYSPIPIEELNEALGLRKEAAAADLPAGGIFGGLGGYFDPIAAGPPVRPVVVAPVLCGSGAASFSKIVSSCRACTSRGRLPRSSLPMMPSWIFVRGSSGQTDARRGCIDG